MIVGASALSVLALPNVALATSHGDSPASVADAPSSTVDSPASAESAASPAASPADAQANNLAQSGDSGGAPTASTQATSAIISAPRAADGEVMNYAVNLSPEATPEQLTQLAEAAKALGAVPLSQYPALDAFFVQSAKATFAADLGSAAQAANIPVHSIGPTRFAQVSGDEVLVQATSAGNSAANGGGGNSQLDEFTPDPESNLAWGLSAIGALDAQKVDVPRAKVTVAILDTGVDGTQVDLDDQIDVENSVGCHVNGIPNNAREAWQDDHHHGTHVAGTVAAEHNGLGVDGVAPTARIMAVKTSNAGGFFYPEYVTCGLMWALDKGADVTNNSYYVDPWAFWIPTEPSQAAGYEVVRRAFTYTEDQGLLHIAAAGNDEYDLDNPTTDSDSPNDVDGAAILNRDVTAGVDIPAMLDSVVTVSSVQRPRRNADPTKFTRSRFSNYGAKHIEIAAPGSVIRSTLPASKGGGWGYLSGTSMASPHVAGVAALLKSIHPTATPAQLRELLYKQAGDKLDVLTDDPAKAYRGRGMVNALDAVLKDQPKPVVGALEYSIDGNTWQPLGAEYNVNVSPKARLRVTVTGPATAASLQVFDFPAVTATSENPFGENLTLTTEELPLADTLLSYDGEFLSLPVTISAEGRNKDPRADDDIVDEGKLALVKKEVVPHPEDLKVEVSDASIVVGNALTFAASGFAIGEEVTFTVYSDPVVVGTVAADQEGRASITWNVPVVFPAGAHTVKAVGTSGRAAEMTFTVKDVSTIVPPTSNQGGTDTTPPQKDQSQGGSDDSKKDGDSTTPPQKDQAGANTADKGTAGADSSVQKGSGAQKGSSPDSSTGKSADAATQKNAGKAKGSGSLAATGAQVTALVTIAAVVALAGAAGIAARKRS